MRQDSELPGNPGTNPQDPAEGVLLTARQVAYRLSLNPISIYRFAAQGIIPSIKIGGAVRFRSTAIDAFLVANETGGRQ